MRLSAREAALAIVRRLRERGFEAYFVGGCVRDWLLGREGYEQRNHDIATSASPDEVSRLFPRVVPVGRRFGVMLVLQDGHCVDVATFRTETGYRDGRRPTGVRFSSRREDVRRRDFTINGLLYDPLEDRLLDYVGGRADIRARTIRAIGDPAVRFAEDRLRLLRAVRFASTLGFSIEPRTRAAVGEHAPEIGVVSGERVRDELLKILIGPRAGEGLLLLDETGLLGPLLPEVQAMKGVRQPPRFHPEGDVFRHTVRLFEEKDRLQAEGTLETRDVPGAEETWDAVTAFAALLHDAGKPVTFSVRDRIRFDGHQIEGARIARAVCDRLRFPSREREMIADCVENHMAFLDVARMCESTLKRLMRRRTFPRELTLHRLDCLASDGNLDAYDTLRRRCREFGEARLSPPPLLTGRDLMAMGWREGPGIGRILAAIEEEQLMNRISTREEALEWLRGGAFRLPSGPFDATNGGTTFRGATMHEMIRRMQAHEKFAEFFVPVDEKTEFRDATYFLREDGTFVFSEGYCHEPEKPLLERHLVSHIVFVPEKEEVPPYAKKKIFGQAYENLTKGIMNTQPLNMFYPLQLKRYLEIDPSLDVQKPPFARYKAMVPVDSLVGHFPHLHSMQAIFARADGGDKSASRIKRSVEASAEFLGIAPEQFGISGSLSIGTYENPHDLDVVIYASVKEVRRIVDYLYKVTAVKEERKVFEFGKYWPIRYWEWVDGEKFMFCPFFSYQNLDECPLRDFTCEVIGAVKLDARVADHTYNAYNPTILGLDKVKLDGASRSGGMRLILYHGGERGDYAEGDRIAGEATHVLVRTFTGAGATRRQSGEYEALLTVNIGDVKKVS